MATLKEVFDDYCSHLKFDQALANAFYKLQLKFINKNAEHMAFFGGNTTGVQVVRFTERDFSVFFDDVVEIDALSLKEKIKEVEAINQNFKVSSDTFNLTCMYLIHRFLTSPSLDTKRRERAAVDVALLFNYRCITAIMANSFRYPADPKLAQATYANLSYRFLIKKLGSWQEVMAFRSQEMIDPEGLHRKAFVKYNDDFAIVYAINDSQGRIRDMVKNIYSEMMKAKSEGDRIYTSSSTMIDADGAEILKDKVHGLASYTGYINSVIQDKNSFIKQELISIIVKMMHTMQDRGFVSVLEWLSDNVGTAEHKEIDELVNLIMVHSYNYLLANGRVLKNSKDIAGILGKLKGIYISSRSTDEDLLKMRVIGSAIVTKSIGKTNDQAVAAIRTGIFLYVCLRAYTKQFYVSH
jgi:hypothetical protein